MKRSPNCFMLTAFNKNDPHVQVIEIFYLSTYKSNSDRYSEASQFIDRMIDRDWLVEYQEIDEVERV